MKINLLILCLLLSTQVLRAFEHTQYEKNITAVNGFIENKGQIIDMKGNLVPNVLFKIKTNNLDCYITTKGITYLFKKYEGNGDSLICNWERVDLTMANASIQKVNILKDFESKQGVLNYHLAHCKDGVTGVKEYGKITIKNIYPSIDWVLYNTSNNGFKYDFILNKGAKPEDIELLYGAKKQVELNDNGGLVISTKFGELNEMAPLSFYDKVKINSHFLIQKTEKNSHQGINTHISIKFDEEIPEIIQEKKLVIDPILEWSTLYGGNFIDVLSAVETDYDDNVVLAGYTGSIDFPVFDGGGYYQSSNTFISASTYSDRDCFVVKFDNQGNRLWATCVGGTTFDFVSDMAVDNAGNIFVVGKTRSTNFHTVFKSGSYNRSSLGAYNTDGIIMKFSPSGALLWSTMFGANSGDDSVESISINPINNHFVIVGLTDSGADFPWFSAPNAINQTGGFFLTEFDNDGVLLWSTGFSLGAPVGVTFDNSGNIFILGRSTAYDGNLAPNLTLQDNGTYFQNAIVNTPNDIVNTDMFFMKIDNNRQVEWSTYFGNSGFDWPKSIAVDGENNIYAYATTDNNDIPLVDAGGLFANSSSGRHALLLKFSNSGNLLWCTGYEALIHTLNAGYHKVRVDNSIVIDKCNNDVYFKLGATSTSSPQLKPISPNSFQSGYSGGNSDVIILKINKNTELLYATYVGGEGIDYGGGITLDQSGNLIVGLNCNNEVNQEFIPLEQGTGYFQDQVGVLPLFQNRNAIFIAKFTKEPINDFLPEVESELVFCDSVLYDTNWYFDNQNISQVIPNQYGCDSVLKLVNLIEDCESSENMSQLHIPNVCSPNGDRVNDSFSITLNNELITKDAILTMYNRWGNKIFFSENRMEWNPENESTGVYFYVFQYKGKNYTGTVSLFK